MGIEQCHEGTDRRQAADRQRLGQVSNQGTRVARVVQVGNDVDRIAQRHTQHNSSGSNGNGRDRALQPIDHCQGEECTEERRHDEERYRPARTEAAPDHQQNHHQGQAQRNERIMFDTTSIVHRNQSRSVACDRHIVTREPLDRLLQSDDQPLVCSRIAHLVGRFEQHKERLQILGKEVIGINLIGNIATKGLKLLQQSSTHHQRVAHHRRSYHCPRRRGQQIEIARHSDIDRLRLNCLLELLPSGLVEQERQVVIDKIGCPSHLLLVNLPDHGTQHPLIEQGLQLHGKTVGLLDQSIGIFAREHYYELVFDLQILKQSPLLRILLITKKNLRYSRQSAPGRPSTQRLPTARQAT